jgi:hypothetical protein
MIIGDLNVNSGINSEWPLQVIEDIFDKMFTDLDQH